MYSLVPVFRNVALILGVVYGRGLFWYEIRVRLAFPVFYTDEECLV